MSAGLYVHVPFCSALCPYCDFAVVVGRSESHERYCEALLTEARARAPELPEAVGSVFVGGGTPSFVRAEVLARTLGALFEIVPAPPGAEITMESNPESIAPDALEALRVAGLNRLSIGAQSFDDDVLRALGRTHDAGAIANAVHAARDAGVGNVSLDLIFGAPGESMASWRATLDAAVALEPEHLSCYALTIEERTAFGTAVARGAMRAPDDDDLAAKYEHAVEALDRAGYRHYEISNWARPGFESRHNLVYWTQGDYLGLGLGAHSHRAGVRAWNTRSLQRYLADPANAGEGAETLDERQRAEEWVSLRMRLLEGLDLAEASRRLGRDLTPKATECAALGLATVEKGRLVLSTKGMLLENEVTVRLLSP